MKRKRRSVGIIAFLVFVALILVSGYALNAAGYDDNPFPEIAFLTSSASSGGGRFAQSFTTDTGSSDLSSLPSSTDDSGVDLTGLSTTTSQFQLPPVSDLSTSDTGAATDPGANTFAGPGPDDQNSIWWSDVSDVLYNLWFICAITAVFIVVQYMFKFSLKQFKRRMPRMAAAK